MFSWVDWTMPFGTDLKLRRYCRPEVQCDQKLAGWIGIICALVVALTYSQKHITRSKNMHFKGSSLRMFHMQLLQNVILLFNSWELCERIWFKKTTLHHIRE